MTFKKTFVFILIFNLLALNVFAQTPETDCICPTIKIIAPTAPVKSGEMAAFTAQVNGDKGQTIYNWSVNRGTVLEGQGTPSINVDTSDLESGTVTATLEIRNGCPTCGDMTASASVIIESDRKPFLVDKFKRANCEDVLARMDYFLTQMQNDPSATGYIIIYGKSRRIVSAEREARNWIKIRRFDPSRIIFVRGGGSGEQAEIELWLVPPGANPPEITPQEANEETVEPVEKPEITKPYIFDEKFSDGIEGCNSDFDVEFYAETLKTNPKSRANIVIYETSQNNFRKIEKEILAEMAKGGIARKRIKTFYKRVKPNQLREGIELWILP